MAGRLPAAPLGGPEPKATRPVALAVVLRENAGGVAAADAQSARMSGTTQNAAAVQTFWTWMVGRLPVAHRNGLAPKTPRPVAASRENAGGVAAAAAQNARKSATTQNAVAVQTFRN